MNILRSYKYIIVFILSVAFYSCGSLHNIPIPLGTNNSIDLPAKKAKLTKKERQTWFHKDIATDTIPGMSIAKAYDFLKGRKNIPVIVAIADSGIQLNHEDLKDVVWKNPKEIPNNNKDDDGNGFVDDINGWNFLGEIYHENLEITRLVKKYQVQFKDLSKEDIPIKDTLNYNEYSKLKGIFEKKRSSDETKANNYKNALEFYKSSDKYLTQKTGKEDYTLEDIQKITPNEDEKQKHSIAIQIATPGLEQGISLKKQIPEIEDAITYLEGYKYRYGLSFHPRKELLKDDENNFDVKVYGNNNPDIYDDGEVHGTHVSGIVLAKNNNNKGIDGVAKNALLMAVRIVPDGDEYDKDVANGIIYAVNNGAKIINTSFGKGYSPDKAKVFEAIKYAEKHDVLIVNAAGNDGNNIDIEKTYPNDSEDLQTEIADNVITIGAITPSYDEKIVASFSNYGKKNVDIFAPGVNIYSCIPKNEYQFNSGTSMAAPSTSGVAAILRSYFPELSAKQVKHIIMRSGTKIPFKVIKPGTNDKVAFTDLCVSGRIVNAYNAVRIAAKILSK